jgi:hypothetical protein
MACLQSLRAFQWGASRRHKPDPDKSGLLNAIYGTSNAPIGRINSSRYPDFTIPVRHRIGKFRQIRFRIGPAIKFEPAFLLLPENPDA